MKKLIIFLNLITLAISFILGFCFGQKRMEAKYLESISDQALVDISRSLFVLNSLGDGVSSEVILEINLNIQRHVASLMRHPSNNDLASSAYRKKTLTRLAEEWRRRAPFKDDDFFRMSKADPAVLFEMKRSVDFVFEEAGK